jgi:hypothetical protein
MTGQCRGTAIDLPDDEQDAFPRTEPRRGSSSRRPVDAAARLMKTFLRGTRMPFSFAGNRPFQAVTKSGALLVH